MWPCEQTEAETAGETGEPPATEPAPRLAIGSCSWWVGSNQAGSAVMGMAYRSTVGLSSLVLTRCAPAGRRHRVSARRRRSAAPPRPTSTAPLTSNASDDRVTPARRNSPGGKSGGGANGGAGASGEGGGRGGGGQGSGEGGLGSGEGGGGGGRGSADGGGGRGGKGDGGGDGGGGAIGAGLHLALAASTSVVGSCSRSFTCVHAHDLL